MVQRDAELHEHVGEPSRHSLFGTRNVAARRRERQSREY